MKEVYQEAIAHLRNGQLILHPCDVGWSVSCEVTKTEAVQRLLQLAPASADAPTVLIAKVEQLSVYVDALPDVAWDIVEFATKPLTVVFSKGKNLSELALQPDGSIHIRLLKDDFCRNMVYRMGRALVSVPVATRLEDVPAPIVSSVGYILKSPQPLTFAPRPTIMRLEKDGGVAFIRK